MKRTLTLILFSGVLGCYQPVVNIGVRPGLETIHQPGARTSIYGLSPASTVEGRDECQHGRRVVGGIDILNGLAIDLAFGRQWPVDALQPCQPHPGPDRSADSQTLEDARPRRGLIHLFHLW